MAEPEGVYKCKICGNVVLVLEAHQGELVCCGQPMELLEAKSKDEGKEKHVPVLERTEAGLKVKIGEVLHPMEEGHYIELVQVVGKGKVVEEKRLYPGDKPEVEISWKDEANLKIRIYCNLHGLWTN